MLRTNLGGDEAVEKQFGKPIYKLRQEWREAITDQTLTQQMQQEIAGKIPELTPYDVKKYIDETDPSDLPSVRTGCMHANALALQSNGSCIGRTEDFYAFPRRRFA